MEQTEGRLKKIHKIFVKILVKRKKVDQFLEAKEQYEDDQYKLKQLNNLGVIEDLEGGYNLFGHSRKIITKWIDPKKKAIITPTISVNEGRINPLPKVIDLAKRALELKQEEYPSRKFVEI
jgi:hypothetical protein